MEVDSPAPGPSRAQALITTFEGYRSHFDDYNERRERLIILNRGITSLSKKLIFHLHRVSLLPSSPQSSSVEGESSEAGPSKTPREQWLEEAGSKRAEILEWWLKVRDELRQVADAGRADWEKGSIDGAYWAYARNVSGAIQEYIEAISFMHYLRFSSLISLEEVQAELVDPETKEQLLKIPAQEYALGISDLTGELMRYATNCSSSGNYDTALHACAFVRGMKAELDVAVPFVRDLNKKQAVTMASLVKIENICYAIQLRMLEYKDRPDVLAHLTKRAMEDSDRREDGDDAEGGAGGEDGGRVGGERGGRGGSGGRGRGGGGGRGGPRGRGRGGGGAPSGPPPAGEAAAPEIVERAAKRGRVEITA